jgi:hypothetical protein
MSWNDLSIDDENHFFNTWLKLISLRIILL